MPGGGTLSLTTHLGEDGRVFLDLQDTGSGIPEAILWPVRALCHHQGAWEGDGAGAGDGVLHPEGPRRGHPRREHAGRRDAVSRASARRRRWRSADDAGGGATRTASPNLAGRRIEVVEDEPLLREMLADALTLARMQVTTAPDGALAWKVWQQAGGFDLVISDQRVPNCTGLELMALIRESGSEVPFILVSGQGLEGMEGRLAADRRPTSSPSPSNCPGSCPSWKTC